MANPIVPVFTQIFSILTVIGQFMILTAVVSILIYRKRKNPLLAFAAKNAVLFALVVASISMFGSLFYSEVADYTPCELCWFQRILMYPQVLILLIAFKMKDKNVVNYSIAMSIIGIVIASYHYLLQRGFAPAVCSSVGTSVSCSTTFVLQYGYITIPMMSLTAFSMILMFALIGKFYKK